MIDQTWLDAMQRQIGEREQMINEMMQAHQAEINKLMTEAVELQGQRKLMAQMSDQLKGNHEETN